jgi:hypothetical protein
METIPTKGELFVGFTQQWIPSTSIKTGYLLYQLICVK